MLRLCSGVIGLLGGLVLLLPAETRATNGFIRMGRFHEYTKYSDVWGYRDPSTGQEYAILGTFTGTSIVNVSDPFNPYETGFVAGPTSMWRDMHVYQGRAYVVSEGTDGGVGRGLQIISLSNPEAPFLIGNRDTFTAHTLWIDEPAGVAYCNGAWPAGLGFRAYNLGANPDNPPLVTVLEGTYIHDLWAGGGTAYTADIQAGGQMRVLDVSALPGGTTITQTGIVTYPAGATHSMWPHPDGIHVLTTDEQLDGTVRVFDVSDPSDIIQVSQIEPLHESSVHNVYMKGDTAYFSWYSVGIRAFDLSDPLDPVLLGEIDTSPSLEGCWSVYPFFPSGVIPCSDIARGLVLVAHVGPAGFIEGTVTRAENGLPIAGAAVKVPSFYNRTVLTDSVGLYRFELPAGQKEVFTSFPGYRPDTSVVTIADTLTTTHDVALQSVLTGIEGGRPDPAAALAAFSAARPNPARSGLALDLSLSRAAEAKVEIFDAAGRRVRSMAPRSLPEGLHTLTWDARDDGGGSVAGGTYFLRVDVAGQARVEKITVIR